MGWLVSSAASAETTITFDPRPAGIRVGIEGYSEGGMVFDDTQSPGSVILADTGGVPSNGTAFVSQCGICRVSLRPIERGLFDLAAVDLGEHLFFAVASRGDESRKSKTESRKSKVESRESRVGREEEDGGRRDGGRSLQGRGT